VIFVAIGLAGCLYLASPPVGLGPRRINHAVVVAVRQSGRALARAARAVIGSAGPNSSGS
jgi:hypothetical protein